MNIENLGYYNREVETTMKRRIVKASEQSDNADVSRRVTEAYDMLQDLAYKLADLSDEFWTLTPTQSWTRINKVLEYVNRARDQMEKVDTSI